MIEFKSIEKASKLFDKIKVLDADIIKIEGLAELLATSETETKITITVTDKAAVSEKNDAVKFDGDGSLIQFAHGGLILDGSSYRIRLHGGDEPNKNKSVDASLHSRQALMVLSVLLAEKKAQRDAIIKQLENIMTV